MGSSLTASGQAAQAGGGELMSEWVPFVGGVLLLGGVVWVIRMDKKNFSDVKRVVLVLILVLGILLSLASVGLGLIGYLFWSSDTASIGNGLYIVAYTGLGVLGVIGCIAGIIRVVRRYP
jgi:hypothetical protein